MITENYIFKKEIDQSVFNYGFAVPYEYQHFFMKNMERGEKRKIRLFFEGKLYEVRLDSKNFDKAKFDNHKDIVQILYSKNSEFAAAIRNYFKRSYEYITAEKLLNGETRKRIKLPIDYKDSIVIYTTSAEDIYVVEPVSVYEMDDFYEEIKDMPEKLAEDKLNFEMTDETAGMREVNRTVHIRKLNKKIGDSLKIKYGYRCQICGRLVGEEYASHVVEAHHIDPFVKSLNNDASNQMIVCPNHHRIIHDVNPEFDRKSLIFTYPNGLKEGLKLNTHL